MRLIDRILAGIAQGDWLRDVAALADHCAQGALSKTESAVLWETFRRAVECRDLSVGTNALIAGLIADNHRFTQLLRREGPLRPSKRGFECEFSRAILDSVLQECVAKRLGEPNKGYLLSIRHMHRIGIEIRRIENTLIERLRIGGNPLLKRLLAEVELAFIKDFHDEPTFGNRHAPPGELRHWSREDLAEAFSYLCFLFREHVGRPDFDCWIDQRVDADRETSRMIIKAATVRLFREWEMLIETFDFRAIESGPDEVRMQPCEAELERSIRLGFMQTDMSFMARHARICDGEQALSLKEAAGLVNERLAARIVRRMPPPNPRLRFELPLFAFEDTKVLAAEGLYREEVELVDQCTSDWCVSDAELLDYEVSDGVRFLDLLRLQRAFQFTAFVCAPHLVDEMRRGESDCRASEIAHASAVGAFTYGNLRAMIRCLIPDERIDRVLEYLSWNPESGEVFDLQYQPLIRADDRFFLATNIAGFSNLLRNSLKRSGQRLLKSATREPERFPALIANWLSAITESVRERCAFEFDGQAGELDVVMRFDDLLVVLEVKDSLLPVNAHEIRTSWDHVQTAVEQLDRFRDLSSDEGFRRHLEERLGFSLEGVTRVETGIVMSNRMFAGLRIHGHPVRSLFDLRGFITDGVVTSNRGESCRLWKGDCLTPDDLVEYFSGDVTLEPYWASMETLETEYEIGAASVTVASIFLNRLKLAEMYGFTRTADEFRAELRALRSAQQVKTDSGQTWRRVDVESKRAACSGRRRRRKQERQRRRQNRR